MEYKIKTIAEGLNFPEGPAFDSYGNLWCVELKGGNLVKYQDGKLTRYPTGGDPNGLSFDKKGRAWFCDSGKNAIRRFNPWNEEYETITDSIDGKPLFKPNDLAFDINGNLIFTCPGDSRTVPTGYVCCLKPGEILSKVSENMYFPNGLSFVNGCSELVVAETYKQRIWRGKWDATECRWVDPAPWAHLGGPVGPDGMAEGSDGLIYAAVYGQKQVKIVNIQGEIVNTIELPGNNPTNIAFDPSGKLGLIVTEAEKGVLLSIQGIGTGSGVFDGGDKW